MQEEAQKKKRRGVNTESTRPLSKTTVRNVVKAEHTHPNRKPSYGEVKLAATARPPVFGAVPQWLSSADRRPTHEEAESNSHTFHMSSDGFYGIDQSATSAQGLENTIRARWWVESVPGPLKRGQEKCSCPLLSGPGTHQERLFARFVFF